MYTIAWLRNSKHIREHTSLHMIKLNAGLTRTQLDCRTS